MKNFLIALIIPLIVAIFVYRLNQKAPELRYQLSSPITVDSPPAGVGKVVQQIEIANSGNAVAQKVQIKIRKPVGDITVTKDSQSDAYQHFQVSGVTELDYDTLRPGGRIKISLSGGEPLTDPDMQIRHQDGVAESALGNDTSVWRELWSGLGILFPVIYLLLSAREAYKGYHIRLRCKVDPIGAIEGREPFFLSSAKWGEILVEEAAPRAAKRMSGETDDALSWQITRLLNSGRPKRLPEGIWAKILPILIDEYTARIANIAKKSDEWPNPEAVRKLLLITKPNNFFDEKWNALKDELAARYRTALLAKAVQYGLRDVSATFDAIRETNMDQKQRDETHRALQMIYYATLVKKIEASFNPVDAFDSAALKYLSESETSALKEFAYQLQLAKVEPVTTRWEAERFLQGKKPTFMAEPDYDRLARLAKAIITVDDDKVRYRGLLRLTTALLNGSEVGLARPSDVALDDWNNLKEIERGIVTARTKNQEREVELTRQENDTLTTKARVLRQLDIINVFMSDPTIVGRIEEYEGVFAPGNLANLKRLAEQLLGPDTLAQ